MLQKKLTQSRIFTSRQGIRQLPSQLFAHSVSGLISLPSIALLASSAAAPIRLRAVSLIALNKNLVSLMHSFPVHAAADASVIDTELSGMSRLGSNQLLFKSKKH